MDAGIAAAPVAVKSPPAAERVYLHVKAGVLDRSYEGGTLLTEGDLAEAVGVSRTPVREALQRLERIGLVTMYPSRFTEVTSLTPHAIEAAHMFAGYQAGLIARMACSRLSETDLVTLSTLIARVADTVDDSAACSKARRDVVGYLAARTGNPLQQSLVDEASMALARALRGLVITPEHRPNLLSGCAELDDALHIGDADAAERACRAIYNVG